MSNYKLTIELVPSTSWYDNVRSQETQAFWDYLRKQSYNKAGYVCEICGDNGRNQGYNHPVECHEVWEYDEDNLVQKLTGLISLCPFCHKCKHIGLAQIKGEYGLALNHLMKVNNMTEDEAHNYVMDCFDKWEQRSNHKWTVDTEILDLERKWGGFGKK